MSESLAQRRLRIFRLSLRIKDGVVCRGCVHHDTLWHVIGLHIGSGEPSLEFTLTVVTGTPMCRRRVEMHFRGARGGVAGREAGGVVLKVFTATMEHVDLDDDVAVIHVRV